MGGIESVAEWIFWVSAVAVILAFVGYPILILALSILRREKGRSSGDFKVLPSVSLIISAFNEESIIAEKMENTLALDYPREKLEIIVASDGSTDQTDKIVASYKDRGVKLYSYGRMGKTGIQNEAVKTAQGEILVFSDANAMYEKDSIRMLVRNFIDSDIGCVCGRLVYVTKKKEENSGEAIYWRYENVLKRAESRVSSLIGVNGSIYAIRKKDYVELDRHLISDLVEPLEIVKRGKRVAYEYEAISRERVSQTMDKEIARKIRLLTRSIQGILYMRCLFNPFRYGIFSLQMFFHKMFRYLAPFLMMIGLLALIILTQKPTYFGIFAAVMVFLGLALVGKFSSAQEGQIWICQFIYYSIMVNYALLLAWVNVIKGRRVTVWMPER